MAGYSAPLSATENNYTNGTKYTLNYQRVKKRHITWECGSDTRPLHGGQLLSGEAFPSSQRGRTVAESLDVLLTESKSGKTGIDISVSIEVGK